MAGNAALSLPLKHKHSSVKAIDIKEAHSDHNCATCHEHDDHEKKHGVVSLVKKIHADNGHACINSDCAIPEKHSHIIEQESHNTKNTNKDLHHEHEHQGCSHKHKDHKHQHNSHSHNHHSHSKQHENSFSIFPLEDFISHAKSPQWLKEFSLNTSFLAPAMLSSSLLETVKIPKIFKTWLAITAMHGLNRGKQKIARLGLTYITSALANLGSKAIGSKLSRFLATSAIAVIEKFSGNGHFHGKETMMQTITRELGNLTKNIQNKNQWLELLPSLLNIETKVQIVAPMVNKLSHYLSSNLKGSTKTSFNLIARTLLTSLSFIATDKLLQAGARALGGKDSTLASSISLICSCCGSPVCAAAATDTALNNSI